MREWIYKNLNGRKELINKLTKDYSNSKASEATVIIGNHGCGKSYVLYEVINNLQSKNHLNKKIQIYIAEDDKLILYGDTSGISIDGADNSISLPIYWGIGIGISTSATSKNSESQFNHICSLLKRRFSSDILIGIPKYSEQDNKIRLLIKMLVSNLARLKKTFKHNIYFLINDIDESGITDFLECASIDKIILEDYEEEDIMNYLIEKHNIIMDQTQITEKLKQIKKICASNFKLIDFLYVDFVEQNLDFFRALDSVVTYRLNQLKKDGLQRNVSEYDMEDIILSSSISLKSFGSHEIAFITHKKNESVRECLQLAYKQVILNKNHNFYSFTCNEIQKIFQKELDDRNKERYLDYYNYYSTQEQDQYYLRAYYLWAYNGYVKDDIFALLILAYSEAINFSNITQIKRIEDIIFKEKDSYFYNDYLQIKLFYNMLREGPINSNELEKAYYNLQRDYYELPLKAELTRAFFHYMYKNYVPWDLNLKVTLNKIIQYVESPIYLTISKYPVETISIDEIVIRLRIIYDIAPYILDAINDIELFKKMYNLSLDLSNNIRISQSNRSIAKYMENVFNRKAFLFVNQTQCNIYYDKAKKYFYDNQIWDEYCITLICEAGTDIVIQKYEEAIRCCQKAKRIAQEKEFLIPQPQKLMNNIIIADFFRYEQNHLPSKCYNYSKKAVRKLQKCLLRIPCATEFVIITNICSLAIYAKDISKYNAYKKYLECLMDCDDVSNIFDDDIDDFYRYYFAWFEAYKCILEERWNKAEKIAENLENFIPSLFQKQEVFWDKKLLALKEIIADQKYIEGYEFCRNLIPLKRRASELASFFCRGLMLSDIQYTSYD